MADYVHLSVRIRLDQKIVPIASQRVEKRSQWSFEPVKQSGETCCSSASFHLFKYRRNLRSTERSFRLYLIMVWSWNDPDWSLGDHGSIQIVPRGDRYWFLLLLLLVALHYVCTGTGTYATKRYSSDNVLYFFLLPKVSRITFFQTGEEKQAPI